MSKKPTTIPIPTQFLAKFRKDEIPLEDLFPVEGQFYQMAKDFPSLNSPTKKTFPFRFVDAIASGPSWILLEYVSPDRVDVSEVHEGCPMDWFDDLLARLARMHALCWVSNRNTTISSDAAEEDINNKGTPASIPTILNKYAHQLSATPGAGHTLPPSARQEKFLPAWPAVRERLLPYFQSDEGEKSLQRLDEIVSWTAQLSRIEGIAKSVADKKYTLVHGDYHIGNMLLPKTHGRDIDWEDGKDHNMPWLVDWSMAGIGNPCVDLVFFLVVGAEYIPTHEVTPLHAPRAKSTNTATKEWVWPILHQYYEALTTNASNNHQHPLLSWSAFQSMLSECILNQFIILVCYDDLCRSMADASPNSKVYHDHFDRVNVRCARLLSSVYGIETLGIGHFDDVQANCEHYEETMPG